MRARVRRWWLYGPKQRLIRFRRWWAAFRHVPHSRSVWCGDMFCPYAEEAKR